MGMGVTTCVFSPQNLTLEPETELMSIYTAGKRAYPAALWFHQSPASK